MSRRVVVGIAVIGLICVGIVAFVIVRAMREATPQRVLMADGTTLFIRGVVAGTNMFTTETRVIKLARRYLPTKWTQRWFDDPQSIGGASNQLQLIFTRKDPTGKKLPVFWGNVEAIDRFGFAYRDDSGSSTAGNNDLLQVGLSAFPRRERRFLVRMYDNQGTRQCEFMVQNPFAEVEFPVWKPEPFPTAKTNGNVRFTLLGLKFRPDDSQPAPIFKIESDDAGLRSGRHMYVSFSDATGNGWTALSTNEPAWKMHVALYRPNNAPFPTNLVWRSPIVAIPTQLSMTNVHWTNVIDGLVVSVPFICGPGKLVISNGTNVSITKPVPVNSNGGWSSWFSGNNRREEHPSSKPFAIVEAVMDHESIELVLNFHDELGRVVKRQSSPGYGTFTEPVTGVKRRRYLAEINQTNCTRASLEIKVNRAIDFDFVVDPRQITK
jgi:hypothetical protein